MVETRELTTFSYLFAIFSYFSFLYPSSLPISLRLLHSLIVLDFVHMMYLSDYHKAYPTAKVIAPEGSDTKKPDVKFTGLLGSPSAPSSYGFEDEIKLHYFPGHANKEIAVLHSPSKTLITADLVFNLPANEQYSKTNESSKSAFPFGWLVTNTLNPWGKGHQTIAKQTGSDRA